MNFSKEISRLSALEREHMFNAVSFLGAEAFAYAVDFKLMLYLAGSAGLYNCYRGLQTTREKNELIRRVDIQDRMGGQRK